MSFNTLLYGNKLSIFSNLSFDLVPDKHDLGPDKLDLNADIARCHAPIWSH